MTTVKELRDMLLHAPDDALILIPIPRGTESEYVFPVVEPVLVHHSSSVSFEKAEKATGAIQALIFR